MDNGVIFPFEVEQEGNKTKVPVTFIPDPQDGDTRSLGKALKMAFFKMVIKQNTTTLSWVSFHKDGTITRNEEGIAEQVSNAQRVLLCMHGIIGDTEEMLRSLHLMKDPNDHSFAALKHYDLVLAFDYENLNTPIENTALSLEKIIE